MVTSGLNPETIDKYRQVSKKAPDRNQPPNVCLGDYGWDISAGTPSPVRAS